ncbi:glycosyltransferase family 4 protein [Siccirubricoccus deserti]|uniref:Glycosyltransferase family 4 protein n=1 Tax=Siccirubricoccus deserti TaxID=2013562 RepID=A0A9X0UC83_9PROT|nr:glycosyltransferase family 4 protein [Siccirubricoccus deserti]MBC4014934.1 glycosyltransferase family 4 protein [Siccirubricoccus deserti]
MSNAATGAASRPAVRTGPPLPDLIVFTPLPPTRSGIAAYAAELLPLLAGTLRIAAVVASARDVVPLPGVAVMAEAEYRRHEALHALPHLHQLGNSLDHAHVYRAALRTPGVLVLHDPVLHHLVEALTLARGDWAAYEAALAGEYGAAGRRLARLRRAGLFDPAQRWLLPLNGAVLDRAKGVLVHSRFAAGRIDRIGGPEVRVVPHHLSPLVPAADGLSREAARVRLGLPQEVPVLLSLGHATPAKRIDLVLAAVARLKAAGSPLLHVIAGASDPGFDLAGLVGSLGLGDRVRITGWLTEADFLAHARAADLLVNLRAPLAGESSGALVRALGMGLPALVDDAGPAAEWPDAVVAKLPVGPEPLPRLGAAIGALLADPAGLAARGSAAAVHVRAACAPAVSAAAYLAALRDWR